MAVNVKRSRIPNFSCILTELSGFDYVTTCMLILLVHDKGRVWGASSLEREQPKLMAKGK